MTNSRVSHAFTNGVSADDALAHAVGLYWRNRNPRACVGGEPETVDCGDCGTCGMCVVDWGLA